ncbi:MAG: VOC family protein [Acidobacteria bacterium]|nr:MAG: VOC family protein [Acidobacteriota bacterium]
MVIIQLREGVGGSRGVYNPVMPVIDRHPSGSFCWIELATTDQNAAKSFYSSLFGWTVNDVPMGPNDSYSMFQLQGRDAGAAYTLRPDQRSQGVPPHWLVYVAVENADDAANRVSQLGGKVLAPAFDVFDVGRMSVLQDPTGAVFAVWQAKKHRGTGITGENGTLCWADLNTPDPARAKQFYEGLFGWKLVTGEKDPSGYLHIMNGEEFIGGIPPAHNGHMPPHWLAYFIVSEVDATADKAKQMGAKVHLPPTTMENVGRFAVLADPQGAAFAIFKEARR